MSAVTLTYLLMAEEGFRLSARVAYPVGILFAILLLLIYFAQLFQWRLAGEETRNNWHEIEKFHAPHKRKKDI